MYEEEQGRRRYTPVDRTSIEVSHGGIYSRYFH